MNLAAVMDELGDALTSINGLRVFPYWVDRISPPAAVVSWPEPLTYDSTMGRGSDRCELPIYLMVGRVDARSSRDELARYLQGGGPSSVKQAIETWNDKPAKNYHSARVIRVQVDVVTVAAIEYLAATFRVDIIGKGE